jgi:hypothetical protein
VFSAHAILWFLGVFLCAWGLSLLVRGAPGGFIRTLWRRPRPRGRPADWWLIGGGLLAVMLGVAALLYGLAIYDMLYGGGPYRSPAGDLRIPIWARAALALAALSIAMLVWALRGNKPRRRECPQCRYDMTGGGQLCPECGFKAEVEEEFFTPRRRRRIAIAAAVLLVVSPSLLLVPKYERSGMVGLVPSTVLIAGFEWLPERLVISSSARYDGRLQDRFWMGELAKWQDRWLGRRVIRVLTSEQSSPKACVRAYSLFSFQCSAGEWDRLISRLINLLCDSQAEVRAAIANEVGIAWMLRYAPDYQYIVRQNAERLLPLLKDEDPAVVVAAAAILVGAPEHAGAGVRAALAQSMANPSPDRLPLVGAYLRAVIDLAMKHEEGRAEVIAQMTSADAGTRRLALHMAAYRMDQLAWSEAEPLAIRALMDPDVQTAGVAVRALRDREVSGGLGMILRAAAARADAERDAMFGILRGEVLQLRQRTGELAALTDDGNPWIRSSALELLLALAELAIDVSDARAAIERALEDGDPVVRDLARKLLDLNEEDSERR